ncbi:MAG: TatD family hydrolase [Bacillota bacterium]|nr:TatD family hydrolase [Bacillota bacterium]
MGRIMTVRGEIDPSQLGFTHIHEHILADLSFYVKENQAFYPEVPEELLKFRTENMAFLRSGFHAVSEDCMRLDDAELMTKELEDFREAGGSSIVEVSPSGIRGDIRALKEMSEKSGVHIVACTGLYGEGSWPADCVTASREELEAFFEREIQEGIDGSGIRPGMVKIACNTMSETEQQALRAGAAAARRSGLPLQVHTGVLLPIDATHAMMEIALAEGLPPERLIMCHMDAYVFRVEFIKDYLLNFEEVSKLTLEPIKAILDRGVNVAFDNFGAPGNFEALGFFGVSDYDRIRGLLALIRQGYSGQIVLGTDCYTKFSPARYGGNGYTRILNFVVPLLAELGVSEEAIADMTVNNPARLLAY